MSDEATKKIEPGAVFEHASPEADSVTPIAKPSGGSLLDRFKSKRPPAAVGVATLIESLPHHPLAHAKDYTRLHPNESTHWSGELCFVNVPIVGANKDTLHLIDEDIAIKYLAAGSVQRFRLALATKPYDVFFLAHVPTTHLDNTWNVSAVRGCEQAKTRWVKLTSLKAAGQEHYQIEFAKDEDAYPAANWPAQSFEELIVAAFSPNRMITSEDHPGLLRLIGAKPTLS